MSSARSRVPAAPTYSLVDDLIDGIAAGGRAGHPGRGGRPADDRGGRGVCRGPARGRAVRAGHRFGAAHPRPGRRPARRAPRRTRSWTRRCPRPCWATPPPRRCCCCSTGTPSSCWSPTGPGSCAGSSHRATSPSPPPPPGSRCTSSCAGPPPSMTWSATPAGYRRCWATCCPAVWPPAGSSRCTRPWLDTIVRRAIGFVFARPPGAVGRHVHLAVAGQQRTPGSSAQLGRRLGGRVRRRPSRRPRSLATGRRSARSTRCWRKPGSAATTTARRPATPCSPAPTTTGARPAGSGWPRRPSTTGR